MTPADDPDPAGRDDPAPATLDVAVVGGGQAGLAIGHLLAEQGRRFAIYEAGDAVGSAWRDRWESLVLFTPRRYDALPGMTFPGDPDGHPTRDEVIAYLESYARRFALPVVTGQRVRTLRPRDGGGFVLESADGSAEADQVVVATGPFQAPYTPPGARTSRRRSSRCTAPPTAGRPTSQPGTCSSWAAATPASRSRRSSRRPTA